MSVFNAFRSLEEMNFVLVNIQSHASFSFLYKSKIKHFPKKKIALCKLQLSSYNSALQLKLDKYKLN